MTALTHATRISRTGGAALLATAVLATSFSTSAMSAATATTTGTGAAVVPAYLSVPPALSGHNFASHNLQPITLGTDPISKDPLAEAGDSISAKEVISSIIQSGGGKGAVAFVVRRPG